MRQDCWKSIKLLDELLMVMLRLLELLLLHGCLPACPGPAISPLVASDEGPPPPPHLACGRLAAKG